MSLAYVRGIHQWPVVSPHKGPIAVSIWLRHHDIAGEMCLCDILLLCYLSIETYYAPISKRFVNPELVIDRWLLELFLAKCCVHITSGLIYYHVGKACVYLCIYISNLKSVTFQNKFDIS